MSHTRYIVLNPVGRVVFTHHVMSAAREVAQEQADRDRHAMTIEFYDADDVLQIENIQPAEPSGPRYPGVLLPGFDFR